MFFRYCLLILIYNLGFGQIADLKELDKIMVNAIAKDNDGRVWLASANGIYRHDGSQILKFCTTSKIGKLENENINGVVYNPKLKKIIATSRNGLYSIDPVSFEVKTHKLNLRTILSDENFFYSPCVDKKGNTWLANKEGYLLKLDTNFIFTRYEIKIPTLINSNSTYKRLLRVEGLSVVENKIIFFNSDLVLCSFDTNTLKIEVLSKSCRGFTGAMSYNNSLLFLDYTGCHFRGLQDTSDRKYGPITLITSSFQDSDGEVWFILDRIKLCKLNSSMDFEMIFELSADQINKHKMLATIFADRKRIWLGTSAGCIVLNKPNPAFEKILSPLKRYLPTELSSRGIVSVNDTTLLCSGYNYLVRYNTKRKTVEPIVSKEIAKGLLSYGLLCTGDSLWIAGEGSGLNLVNYKTGEFRKIKYSNSTAKHQYVKAGLLRSIAKIDSSIFISDYGFLFNYNLYNYRVNYCDSPTWPYPYFNDKSRGIIQILQIDKNNILFISAFKVYITDKQLRVKSVIDLCEPTNPDRNEVKILNAMIDQEGCFWLATERNGLCRYNLKSGDKTWYTKEKGICDNTVYCTLQSNDGRIWAATNYGLSVIDFRANTVNNYFEEDGIVNNEFNTNSYHKTNNGEIYFGGMKGVTRIIPHLLSPRQIFDPFVFSSITIAGVNKSDSLILSNLSDSMNVTLPNHSRFINVKFSLMNFSSKNRYEFRLQNVDSTWTNLGNSSSIIYNSLDPGLYTLQVRAWDEIGNLSPQFITLFIEVEQYFYLKWWFILLLVLVFIFLTGLIFYIIYRNKIKNMDRIAEVRLKIASDLHDQVGGLLNKTASQAELVNANSTKDSESLNKIATNSRSALNTMHDILWNLDPRNDNPESLVRRMNEYAHKMMEDTNSYELNLGDLKKIEMNHEVRQTINIVFNEAINNVVKHAPNQKVEVNATKHANGLTLSISNTGPFELNEDHTGQGLRNMKMRIEKIGGSFEIEVNDKVILYFKIPNKSLNSY